MRAVTTLILIVTFINTINAYSPAGIYVDNGYDQTTIQHAFTKVEKREMELEILNLLGLPNRPRKGAARSFLNKSAPQFLLDVYKSMSEEENGRIKRNADLNLSDEEQNAIDESDLIMTFDSISHHVSGVRHERGKRLWFNVSEVNPADMIVGAELRIYQNSNYTVKNPNAKYVVAAYELTRTQDGERELEYVAAVNTTAGFTGWLELNLTSCFAAWVAISESNRGIYLSVHPINRPAHEVRPEDIGLVTTKGDAESQPFLVAFLKSESAGNVRITRDVGLVRPRKPTYSSIMRRDTHRIHEEKKSCQIQTLYINFKDLNWTDWIIAPGGYHAHYCAGECNFPLNSNMNATNHAIVQTLAHLISPTKFPKPCCVPTRLIPISVLYQQNEGSITLKKYRRMTVKSCGCL